MFKPHKVRVTEGWVRAAVSSSGGEFEPRCLSRGGFETRGEGRPRGLPTHALFEVASLVRGSKGTAERRRGGGAERAGEPLRSSRGWGEWSWSAQATKGAGEGHMSAAASVVATATTPWSSTRSIVSESPRSNVEGGAVPATASGISTSAAAPPTMIRDSRAAAGAQQQQFGPGPEE